MHLRSCGLSLMVGKEDAGFRSKLPDWVLILFPCDLAAWESTLYQSRTE
jgi:hypothetical protein